MLRSVLRATVLVSLLALSATPATVSAVSHDPTGSDSTVTTATVSSITSTANASLLGLSGRLWAYDAANSNASMRVWNLATNTLAATFTLRTGDFWGNGRGVAFDATDGNIWNTVVNADFAGDGLIHKNPALGGADITTIPDPGGINGPGIGALAYDTEDNTLWVAVYQPINNMSRFYKLNPANGNVLKTCEIPFAGAVGDEGNDTLAVAHPSDLGGKKVLLSDAAEFASTTLFAVDPTTCQIVKQYTLPVGVTGIDEDQTTKDLVVTNIFSFYDLGSAPYNAIKGSFPTQGLVEGISLEKKPTAACASPRYAAGGDSIAAGADLTSGTTYPQHLMREHLLSFNSQYCLLQTAQSGATTANYIRGLNNPPDTFVFSAQLAPTLDFISSGSDGDRDLVTITVSADDGALPTLVNQCVPLLFQADVQPAIVCEANLLNSSLWTQIANNLSLILTQYEGLLTRRPNLVVAVTNYYNPMPRGFGQPGRGAQICSQLSGLSDTGCNFFIDSRDAALVGNEAVITRLNTTIANVVSGYSAASNGRIVLVDIHSAFQGHCTAIDAVVSITPGGTAMGNLGCSQSWITPSLTQGSGSANGTLLGRRLSYSLSWSDVGVHPNDVGHKCISTLIWEAAKAKLGSSEQPVANPC
jgi:hypothetical protein